MTSAERQARYRAKRAAEGLQPVTLMLPEGCIADLMTAAELMRANPDLTIARLVSRTTGKLIGLKAKPAKSP